MKKFSEVPARVKVEKRDTFDPKELVEIQKHY